MPHQCTDCARTFDDGSKEMLSGCPDCGGTTFQYRPAEANVEDGPTAAEPPEPDAPGEGTVARTVGSAATAVRDLVGASNSPPEPPEFQDETGPGHAPTGETDAFDDPGSFDDPAPADATVASSEDAAQASARTDVVSPSELPSTSDRMPSERPTPVVDDHADGTDLESDPEPELEDRPGLDDLREELNEQFESIKVLEPGQYELNLMELYDREEYIIALQEDGRYTIQVPERWEDD